MNYQCRVQGCWAFAPVLAGILSLALLGAPGRSQPLDAGSPNAGPTPATAPGQTNDVFARWNAWVHAYLRNTNAAGRSELPADIAIAMARADALTRLIENDPEAALKAALPDSIRRRLPAEIRSLLEEPISGVGDLMVVAATFPAKDARPASVDRIVRLSGREFQAFVYGRRKHRSTKYGVSLHGIALRGKMAVHETPAVRLSLDEQPARHERALPCPLCRIRATETAHDPASVIKVSALSREFAICSLDHFSGFEEKLAAAERLPGPWVTYPSSDAEWTAPLGFNPAAAGTWSLGLKNVLLVRVDFVDLPGEPIGYLDGYILTNLTAAAGMDLITNRAARFFQEGSYGQTELSGTVTPVLRLPRTIASYATNNDYYGLHADARNAAASAGFPASSFDRIAVAFSTPPAQANNQFYFSGRGEVGGRNLWLHRDFTTGVLNHELGHTYGLWHANAWHPFEKEQIGAGLSVEYGDIYDTMGNRPNGLPDFNPWFKSMLGWLAPGSFVNVQSNGLYRVSRFDHPQATGTLALKIPRDADRNYWVGLRGRPTNDLPRIDGAYVIWGYNENRASDLLDMAPDEVNVGLPTGRTFLDTAGGVQISIEGQGGVAPHEFLDVRVRVDAFPPRIVASPTNLTILEGATGQFSVAVQSSVPPYYQWRFNGNPLAGVTGPVLTLPAATEAEAGDYSVIVSNSFGVVTGAVATLRVTTPFGLALDALDLKWRTGGSIPWLVQSAVTHDGFDALQSGPISDNSESWMETTVAGPGRLSFWWKVSSERNRDLLWFQGGGETLNISGEVDWREIVLTIPAGSQVLRWRYVKDSSGNRGDDRAWIDEAVYVTPPSFARHPESQRVPQGATVTFDAVTINAAAGRYQWQKNGVNLPNETNASLTLFDVPPQASGDYAVTVSNIAGARTSQPASLVVNPTPLFAWARKAGGVSYDSADEIAIDPAGNVCVAGSFAATAQFGSNTLTSLANYDTFVAKYNPKGELGWVRQLGTTNADLQAVLTTDRFGQVYVGGQFNGELRVGNFVLSAERDQIYLVKFDPQGTPLWALQTQTDTGYNRCRTLAVDQDGNVILGATVYPNAFGELPTEGGDFVVKMNASGNILWMRLFESSSVLKVALDSAGSIFALSEWHVPADNALVLSKLDGEGGLVWNRRMLCQGSSDIQGLSVDPSGASFVLATLRNEIQLGERVFTSKGDPDLFWARFDPNGNLLFADSAGGTTFEQASGCSSDRAGNVYFTGIVNGAPTLQNTPLGTTGWTQFVASLDPKGRLSWVRRISLGGALTFVPAVDRAANVYLAGRFAESVTAGSTTLTSSGLLDVFVAKLETVAPVLRIARAQETTLLSWPMLAEGFSLERTTNAQSQAGWQTVPSTPSLDGEDYRVLAPASGQPTFFRLRK